MTLPDSNRPAAPSAGAQRLCTLFPHLILGGGETAMMALAEQLGQHFELAVCALVRRPMTVEPSARDELLRRFGRVGFIKTENELRARLEGADALLWFGMNPFTPETLAAMPSRPTSIRIVHTGKDEEGLDYHRRFRHCIDRAVCVSPAVARRIPGAVFIPNTCSPDRLLGEPLDRPAARPRRPVLGWLGRLFPFKNVHWLIEHLAALDCDLLVQGLDTAELARADLERLAGRLGLAERVAFLPPGPRVGALLRSVDAMVVASQIEGFPMVAVEAGMLGVPLIATRVGALPELLAEEVLWIESESDGAPALASLRAAVARLDRSWGDRLRAKIVRLCAPEVVAGQYVRLIREVVAERALDPGGRHDAGGHP